MKYSNLEIGTVYFADPVEYIVLYKDSKKMIWIAKLDEMSLWKIWIWTKEEWNDADLFQDKTESVGSLDDLMTLEDIFRYLFENGIQL